MKSKLKMQIKTFGVIRINSLTVNIQKTPHSSINQIKVIGKFKGEASGIPIKSNFNSCSSKTVRKRQNSHRINNFYATKKKLADKFP